MNFNRLAYIFLPIVLVINACSRPIITPSIETISLDENLHALQDKANEWNQDAYLVWIKIPLNHYSTYLISAHFESLSENNESLIIRMVADDLFQLSRIKHENGVTHVLPLTKNLWMYDSPTVMQIFLQDVSVQERFDAYDLDSLQLEHYSHKDQRVIWVLTFTKPDFTDSVYYFFDPEMNNVRELLR